MKNELSLLIFYPKTLSKREGWEKDVKGDGHILALSIEEGFKHSAHYVNKYLAFCCKYTRC